MNSKLLSKLSWAAAACAVVWASSAWAAPSGDSAEEGKGCNGNAVSDDPSERVSVPIGDAPTIGPAYAKVSVVIYSDFQCPFCKVASERVRQLRERYGDKIRIAFKQRPLPMHPAARIAAAAALAAHRQGQFWAFHDAIFARDDKLDQALLDKTAEKLGLNLASFKKDLDSKVIAELIAADEAEAAQLDVKGTPTFFINGRRVTGAQPLDVLTAAIDQELGG